MTMMVCSACEATFGIDEAIDIVDHDDDMYDRPLIKITMSACPMCGSTEMEEEQTCLRDYEKCGERPKVPYLHRRIR